MRVHLFGATSSPLCASFALRQAAKEFGPEFEPYIASAIEESFYVDDFLISVPNIEIGLEIIKSVKTLLSRAGFHLTKWFSNRQEIMDAISEAERSQSFMINAIQGNTKERVLGVNWDIAEDYFCFDVELPWKRRNKRRVLAIMNSLFDPLRILNSSDC